MSAFNGWTAEHSNPIITTDISGHILTLSYFATWANAENNQPEINSLYPGDLVRYKDTRLTSINKKNDAGGERAKITLVYKSEQQGSGSESSEIEENATVYTMSDGALEKPVETHDDYTLLWNYSMSKKKNAATSKPTLTGTTDSIPEASSGDWKWVKDASDMGEDWSITDAATKKGKESYIIGAPVVNEKKYYKYQTSASSVASSVGSKVTPGNTFGKSGGEWLVIGSEVYYENGLWVADLRYQWADEWDADIYA